MDNEKVCDAGTGEINFIDLSESASPKHLKLEREDLPLVITFEGRKDYVLNLTPSGGVILNKKNT